MNELLFNFEGKQVEVINFNGQALFNPCDVGECLDISNSALRNHLAEMNQNQVIKLTNDMISKVPNCNFRKLNNFGENFLTEFGVYKLIFKSRKPSAERFQDWVTDAVLPRIRQYGAYIPGNNPEQIIQNGISAMDGMVSLSKYNDTVNYYLKANNTLSEMHSKLYLDRFKNLRTDILYEGGDVYRYVLDKDKYCYMSDEEFNNLLINLGFLCIDQAGHYHPNAEKVISLDPLTLTYKGLIELSYAIDNPSDIYFHF